MTDLDTVAFDIETTGFGADDAVTVAGLDTAAGSRVLCQTGGRPAPTDLERRVDAALHEPVDLSTHETERELLAALSSFVRTTVVGRDAKVVAYNGERYRGGFDLPFVRTRLAVHGVEWPFVDLPYVDAMDVFESQFNTTRDTLVGVYDELLGDGLSETDPFADSGEAVTAWDEGDFEALVVHNVADIRRTRALTTLAERYCSKSDFSMKSLDPVVGGR